jgi:hypothetical protein
LEQENQRQGQELRHARELGIALNRELERSRTDATEALERFVLTSTTS